MNTTTNDNLHTSQDAALRRRFHVVQAGTALSVSCVRVSVAAIAALDLSGIRREALVARNAGEWTRLHEAVSGAVESAMAAADVAAAVERVGAEVAGEEAGLEEALGGAEWCRSVVESVMRSSCAEVVVAEAYSRMDVDGNMFWEALLAR